MSIVLSFQQIRPRSARRSAPQVQVRGSAPQVQISPAAPEQFRRCAAQALAYTSIFLSVPQIQSQVSPADPPRKSSSALQVQISPTDPDH